MDLRRLRYFVAVAEEGSFTRAAEQRLRTAQPSLSRQIRDLEEELEVRLIVRNRKGIELTSAGRVLLDHARIMLSQAEVATQATRRAAKSGKMPLVIGFLSGFELEWLPEIARLLRDQLDRTELVLQSSSSPDLIRLLKSGGLDVAFLRPDRGTLEVAFKRVIEEPLMAILPSGHRLAKRRFVRPRDFENEVLIAVSHDEAPTLRGVIDTYLTRSQISLRVGHEAVNLPTIFSLVLSTPGVSLLPTFARKLAPPSITCVPLEPDAPKVELAIGYNKTNASGLLRLFLSRVDDLILERAGAPN